MERACFDSPGTSNGAARCCNGGSPVSGDISHVLFVDDTGALKAARVVGIAPWEKPKDVSAANFAPPGAGVAAVEERPDLICAFVVGLDGALYAFRRRRQDRNSSGPIRLTQPDFAGPGASVSAAKQADDLAVVAFEAIDARPHICWSVGGGPWQGPARISWWRIGKPHIPLCPASRAALAKTFGPSLVRAAAALVPGSTVHVAKLTSKGTRNPSTDGVAKGSTSGPIPSTPPARMTRRSSSSFSAM